MSCHTSFQRMSTLEPAEKMRHTFRSVQLPQHQAREFVSPKKQDIESLVRRQTRQTPVPTLVPRRVDEFPWASRPEPRRHKCPGLTAHSNCGTLLPRDVTQPITDDRKRLCILNPVDHVLEVLPAEHCLPLFLHRIRSIHRPLVCRERRRSSRRLFHSLPQ